MSLPAFDGPALLAWYRAHRRRMPWRDAVSPYRTLVSEVMLQQTRVETVIPYFERFVATWPDFEALAAAPLADVLARWSGLGYYRRARMLHAAAQAVVAQGGVPRTPDGLRALPGVGPYTAGAVGSIALGLDMALVDGNVERVLCRHDARPEPPATIRRALWARAESLVPPGEAGDHNQALMELGATVCTPTSPACGRCPLARGCAGRAEPARYPARVAKRAVPEAHCHVARVVEDGAVLLVRRAGTGLLGGLWELPGSVPSPVAEDPGVLVTALRRRAGMEVTDIVPRAP
ncbi:MAG: A/G-specific adenine glycosylase, partial [Pseudomonadota bacterium]